MQSGTSALSDHHQDHTWIALVLIVIVGAALGLHQIGSKSLWSDEIVSVRIASGSFGEILRTLAGAKRTPPLHYFLLHPFTLVGTDEFTVRLPSFFLSLLGVCACYQLGRLFFNKPVGAIAALFLAVSPLHVRYAQEVRMYSLFELLSVLSLYFFYKGVAARRAGPWLGYIIVTLLSMYTQPFTVLYIAVQGAFLAIATLISVIGVKRVHRTAVVHRSAWACFALSLVAILILFAPWLPSALASESGGGLFQRFDAVLWGTFRCLWAGKETLLSYVLGALALLGSITCVWTRPAKGGLLLSWVLLPIPLAFLTLFLMQNFYAIRYLIFILPVYVILAAYGVTVLGRLLADFAGRHVNHAIPQSGVSLVLALLLAGPLNALPLHEYYDARKPPWREVGAFLDEQVSPDDIVLVQPPWQTVSIRFYSSLTQLSTPETLDRVVEAAATHSVIWFVRTDDVDQTEPSRAITQWFDKQGAITLTFNGSLTQRIRDQEINRTQRDILVSLYRDSWHGDSAALQEGLDLIANIEALWPRALRVDLTLARLYARYGPPERAVECYQRALDDLPNHLASAAYLELGVLHREQGNVSQSAEAFRQAISLYPNNGWYHLRLADALVAAGMPADAVAEYQEAVRWLPDLETNAWLYLQIGMAYREAGNRQEAIAAYERALELDGNNPEALGWLEILR